MKKKITNYLNYEIDTKGNIYKNNKLKKLSKDKKGYLHVSLSKNDKKQYFLVHRLVALEFIPNTHNYSQVNHIDGNKSNNIIENLEWCTPSQNIKHSFLIGKSNYKGEKNGKVKISDLVINQIRTDFSNGTKRKDLSFKYNISYSHIVSIIANKRR